MRSIAQMAEDVIAIRTNAKYAFITPETIAIMLQTQQLERIADALEARADTPIAGLTVTAAPVEPMDRHPARLVGIEQAVANQQAAPASPVIPRFNPQSTVKRK